MANNHTKSVALGGVTAALAVVIMCLGGIIPVATYVCPALCAILLSVILRYVGCRLAWAWYVAVALLSVLMGPDKEAAAVFVFLGYYPIVKPWIDRRRLPVLWKLALFNASVAALYAMLIYLFRMEQVIIEFREMGTVLTAVTLLLGNGVLFLLDFLLGRMPLMRKR